MILYIFGSQNTKLLHPYHTDLLSNSIPWRTANTSNKPILHGNPVRYVVTTHEYHKIYIDYN